MKKTFTSMQSHFADLCRKLFGSDSQTVQEVSSEPTSAGNLSGRLAKHFVACSAAAVLAAGSVGDVSGAIVHWSNANLIIPNNIDGLYINVETQATGSLGTAVAGWDINPYSATALTWFNGTGTGMARYPGVTTGSAGNQALGTAIDATRSYGNGSVVVGSAPGNWQLNSSNYFGFRFIAADGLTHYAWGRFVIGASISGADRMIAEIAYESVAGVGILVGQTPPTCTAPTLSASTVAAICQGASSGSVDLTITGGSPSPFSIVWSNGATSEDLSNVPAGTYTVTVSTDGGGCSTSASYTVNDGPVPSLWYADSDGDGYGAGAATSSCDPISGSVTIDGDCDDNAAAVNPAAAELCNNIDDNCNGLTDDGLSFLNYYADGDGDGYGAGAATSSCAPISGSVTIDGDCDDNAAAVNPVATEVCNNIDDNCNGLTDDGLSFLNYYADADGDGYGAGAATSSCAPISGSVTVDGDCDDNDNSVNPGVASDVCNGVDNDCDGATDEDATFSNYYVDGDGDGYGAGAATSSCSAISGSVLVDGDCDDNAAAVNPAAAEVCNSIDDDCDGATDEGTIPVAGPISGPAVQCVAVTTGTATFSIANVAGASSYTWSVPAGMNIVSGQGSNSIFVSWTPGAAQTGIIGNLSVIAANFCGSSAPSTVAIDINYTSPVMPNSISGSNKVCPGNIVIYSTSNIARGSAFLWTLPAGMTILSGANTNVISVAVDAAFTGGTIGVSATNACGVGPARLRAVAINLLPAPASISGQANGICGANGVTYTAANVVGATSYIWSVPAGATIASGQGSNSITVNFSPTFGGGNISAQGTNGCGNGSIRTLSVTGAPGIAGPISGDITICTGQSGVEYSVATVPGATTYNWSVPSIATISAGQGNKNIFVTWGTNPTSGQQVSVNTTNACGTSATRILNGIAISLSNCLRVDNTAENLQMTVYPNPATGFTQISFYAQNNGNARLNIIDMTGKIVFSEQQSFLEGNNTFVAELHNIAAGIYLVQVQTDKGINTERLTIE